MNIILITAMVDLGWDKPWIQGRSITEHNTHFHTLIYTWTN